MRRLKLEQRIVLLRTRTKIIFSKDDVMLGTVIMTNPGSFKMGRHLQWDDFSKGKGNQDIIQGIGTPDTTMQNLIEVILKAFEPNYPKGYLSVLNITALVEPDGEKIVSYHGKMLEELQRLGNDTSILYDSEVYHKDMFQQHCEYSPFIMMGFLNDIFHGEVLRIREWSKHYESKLVFALDKQGRLVHPFCWRLKPEYKEQAIKRLKAVLQNGSG
ncbi:hypothetical protein [Paenibacillus silvestris]|nr:hypothetical protein [Paenibacillus silvestris]